MIARRKWGEEIPRCHDVLAPAPSVMTQGIIFFWHMIFRMVFRLTSTLCMSFCLFFGSMFFGLFLGIKLGEMLSFGFNILKSWLPRCFSVTIHQVSSRVDSQHRIPLRTPQSWTAVCSSAEKNGNCQSPRRKVVKSSKRGASAPFGSKSVKSQLGRGNVEPEIWQLQLTL